MTLSVRRWRAGIAVCLLAASCSGNGNTGAEAGTADSGFAADVADAIDGQTVADAAKDIGPPDAAEDTRTTDAPADTGATDLRPDGPVMDVPEDHSAPDADDRASTDAPSDTAGPVTASDAREGGNDADPCAGCTFTKIAADGIHLVHDATRARLYVTQLSTAVRNPDTLAIIDLATASITANLPIGRDPRPLALSDDASTLWVGLSGDHALRKVTLTGAAPSVGPLLPVPPEVINSMPFATWPVALAVLPGSATTLVASITSSGSSTRVYVFDDGVPRPTITSSRDATASRLAVGPPGYVFGYDSLSSGFGLSVFTVAASGITLLSEHSGLIGGFEGFLVYDHGHLFSFYGEVVDVSDPTKPVRSGKFSHAGAIAVRDANHVFMASPAFLIGEDVQKLRLYDTTTLTEVASVTVPANLIPATSMFTDLVYLGGDALAFIVDDYDNSNAVFIAHVPSLVEAR